MDSGDWDADALISPVFVPLRACTGNVGAGVVPDSLKRFCGTEPRDQCGSRTHTLSWWRDFSPGFYLPGGPSSRSGFYRSPFLPAADQGGPITQDVADALFNGPDPFKLTLGQWKFVFDAWLDFSVSTPSSGGQLDNPHPHPLASRQTQRMSEEDSNDSSILSVCPSRASDQSSRALRELRSDMDSLLKEVSSLRRRARETDALQARVDSLTHTLGTMKRLQDALHDDFERVQGDFLTPGGRFMQLRSDLDIVQKAVSVGRGVEAHGANFSHPSEIVAWLLPLDNNISIFHDAVSMLHSIGSVTSTHKSTLATMKAQRDVQITSDMEARIMTSFRTNLPAVLYPGGSPDSADGFVSLSSRLKSYKLWHSGDGVSGVSQRMARGAAEVQQRTAFLANHLTTDPSILRLANGMLIDSVNFIKRLISFVDTWVIDLKAGSYFSEDQVWEVMVASIEQIFDDLRSARAPIQDASESDKAMLLWGLLKSHEVMRRYVHNDFKNDPSLNGILVQEILQDSPASDLKARMGALEKKSTQHDGTLTNLKSRVSTLESSRK